MFHLSAFRYACGEGCEWFADLQICGGLLLFLARLVNVTGLSSTMGAHFGSKRGQCVYLSARVLTPPCPPRLFNP